VPDALPNFTTFPVIRFRSKPMGKNSQVDQLVCPEKPLTNAPCSISRKTDDVFADCTSASIRLDHRINEGVTRLNVSRWPCSVRFFLLCRTFCPQSASEVLANYYASLFASCDLFIFSRTYLAIWMFSTLVADLSVNCHRRALPSPILDARPVP